jgi:hypothetical protein
VLSAVLREHKELLDKGALTPEEFAREKEHLLEGRAAPRSILGVLREYRDLLGWGALPAKEIGRLEAALTLSTLLRELKDLLDKGAVTPEELAPLRGLLLAELQARVVTPGHGARSSTRWWPRNRPG